MNQEKYATMTRSSIRACLCTSDFCNIEEDVTVDNDENFHDIDHGVKSIQRQSKLSRQGWEQDLFASDLLAHNFN